MDLEGSIVPSNEKIRKIHIFGPKSQNWFISSGDTAAGRLQSSESFQTRQGKLWVLLTSYSSPLLRKKHYFTPGTSKWLFRKMVGLIFEDFDNPFWNVWRNFPLLRHAIVAIECDSFKGSETAHSIFSSSASETNFLPTSSFRFGYVRPQSVKIRGSLQWRSPALSSPVCDGVTGKVHPYCSVVRSLRTCRSMVGGFHYLST